MSIPGQGGARRQYGEQVRLYAAIRRARSVIPQVQGPRFRGHGFTSNDFGGQEPGNNKQIAEFCRTTYGVQFPLYEKTTVTELSRNPLYLDLVRATGEAPKWNFHKYLVDRSGKPVASFISDVEPDSRELVTRIEALLASKAGGG